MEVKLLPLLSRPKWPRKAQTNTAGRRSGTTKLRYFKGDLYFYWHDGDFDDRSPLDRYGKVSGLFAFGRV